MDHRVKPGDDDHGCCTGLRHLAFPIQFSNSHFHSRKRIRSRATRELSF
jgi:hypothetical protein